MNSSGSNRYPVGVRLDSLRQPFKQALVTASRLKAEAVEINAREHLRPASLSDTALRQLRKMLDDLRLTVSAIAFPTRRGYHITEDLDRRVQATKSAMDMAYALGARVVTNHVGCIPEPASDSDSVENPDASVLRDALTDIGRHGQRCGAFLAARTGGEDAEAMGQLIESLPTGYLFADFDPGNFIVHGFSSSQALSRLANHIVHVHARDGVADLARGRGIEVAVGQGSVDWFELLAKLEQVHYQGYLTIERSASDQVVASIADAIDYLREIQR